MEKRVVIINSIEIYKNQAFANDDIKIVVCSFDDDAYEEEINAELLKVERDAFEVIKTLPPNMKIERIDFAREVESSIYVLVYRKSADVVGNVFELFDEISIRDFIGYGSQTKILKNSKCKLSYTVEGPKVVHITSKVGSYVFIVKQVTCYKQEDWTGKDQLRLELTPDNGSKKKFPNNTSHRNIGKGQKINFQAGDAIKVVFQNSITLKVLEIDRYDANDTLGFGTFYGTEVSDKIFKATQDGADYSIVYDIKVITKVIDNSYGGFNSTPSTGYKRPNFRPFFKKIDNTQKKLSKLLSFNEVISSPLISTMPIVEKLNDNMNPLNSAEKARVEKFIGAYYEEFFSNPDVQKRYFEELTHSQYPVMAYPVFPEPAYYYLKQFSEKLILPASGSMPDNSMALFVNNPVFVEAFLCGMNTEMGRELLWREYPTDSRGSYFRKFWDSEIKKDIGQEVANDSFFDILPIHKWENDNANHSEILKTKSQLGQNHMSGKDDLLIFAIKGELLKKYPETLIFLSKGELDHNKIMLKEDALKILPDLSAWLGDDTFIVGFPSKFEELIGNPATNDPGYFLTFMNRPAETRFGSSEYDFDQEGTEHSGESAANLLVQPYIFGKHISQFLDGWKDM